MSVQQADQTPLVYPVSIETSPPSYPEQDGSFAAVFIVLAVIVAISTIACFLGRLCNKRYYKPKPSKRGRHTKEKDMKPNRNAFQTKDGEIEFGFDKRFSSAKVANNGEPNMGRPNSFNEQNMGRPNSFHEQNMGRPNSFHEQNMGPNLGQPISIHEPNMGRTNSFHEPNMGRPNLVHEPNMGRPISVHEPNMGRPNSFREQNMGPNLGRPNSYREHMGPNPGQPSSFREPPMGRADMLHEPSMGRPNSFRKSEYRDDQMRYGGDDDHQMRFNSSTGTQYY